MRQAVLYIDEHHLKEFERILSLDTWEEDSELKADLTKWLEHQRVSFRNAFA